MTLIVNYGTVQRADAIRLQLLGLLIDCGNYFLAADGVPMHIIENTL